MDRGDSLARDEDEDQDDDDEYQQRNTANEHKQQDIWRGTRREGRREGRGEDVNNVPLVGGEATSW